MCCITCAIKNWFYCLSPDVYQFIRTIKDNIHFGARAQGVTPVNLSQRHATSFWWCPRECPQDGWGIAGRVTEGLLTND